VGVHREDRAAGGPTAELDRRDLLNAEWQLLSLPTTDRQYADFRAVPTVSPEGYYRLLDQVVFVSRRREVRALLGFIRLAAPERGDLQPVRLVSHTRGSPGWVPAVEQRCPVSGFVARCDAVTRADNLQ
jgi:hypothetical protein